MGLHDASAKKIDEGMSIEIDVVNAELNRNPSDEARRESQSPANADTTGRQGAVPQLVQSDLMSMVMGENVGMVMAARSDSKPVADLEDMLHTRIHEIVDAEKNRVWKIYNTVLSQHGVVPHEAMVKLAVEATTGQEAAVKFERLTEKEKADPQNRLCSLEREAKLLRKLRINYGIKEGIPEVYYCGRVAEYGVMITEKAGRSLLQVLQALGPCSLKAGLQMGIQILDRLEKLHDTGYMHCSVKPSNFLCDAGIRPIVATDVISGAQSTSAYNPNTVYMVDLGCARRWQDKETKEHIKRLENQEPRGCPLFMSRMVHAGVQMSRRDDIESLAYMLIYLIRGSLPWGNNATSHLNVEERLQYIRDMKRSVDVAGHLCQGLPLEFAEMVNYARELHFKDRPDYEMLRQKLRYCLEKHCGNSSSAGEQQAVAQWALNGSSRLYWVEMPEGYKKPKQSVATKILNVTSYLFGVDGNNNNTVASENYQQFYDSAANSDTTRAFSNSEFVTAGNVASVVPGFVPYGSVADSCCAANTQGNNAAILNVQEAAREISLDADASSLATQVC